MRHAHDCQARACARLSLHARPVAACTHLNKLRKLVHDGPDIWWQPRWRWWLLPSLVGLHRARPCLCWRTTRRCWCCRCFCRLLLNLLLTARLQSCTALLPSHVSRLCSVRQQLVRTLGLFRALCLLRLQPICHACPRWLPRALVSQLLPAVVVLAKQCQRIWRGRQRWAVLH